MAAAVVAEKITEDLRPHGYFIDRADADMEKYLKPTPHTLKKNITAATKIITLHEEDAGLAGQISASQISQNTTGD